MTARSFGQIVREARLERHLGLLAPPHCAVRFAGLIGPARPPGRFLAGRTDLAGGERPVNLVQQIDCLPPRPNNPHIFNYLVKLRMF